MRCFHALTAPGRRLTLAAKAAGPPLASMISAAEFLMQSTLPKVTDRCNEFDTHGNVTGRNVRGMNDDDWKSKKEPWQRLKWARERWQRQAEARSMADAARSLGMKEGTYRAYERRPGASKHTPLDYEMAVMAGRKFKVSWAWLLKNEGSPYDVDQTVANKITAAPMLIVVKAEFDPESHSWWAAADIDDRHALATGAPTFEELLKRIPIVLQNLLADAYPDAEIPFSVVAHKSSVVNIRAA